MVNDEGKIPYTPPTGRRWFVSRDRESRARIHALVEVQRTLEEEFSWDEGLIHTGIALGGSLSKGKDLSADTVAQRTDVDLNIFFEGDNVYANVECIVAARPDGLVATLWREDREIPEPPAIKQLAQQDEEIAELRRDIRARRVIGHAIRQVAIAWTQDLNGVVLADQKASLGQIQSFHIGAIYGDGPNSILERLRVAMTNYHRLELEESKGYGTGFQYTAAVFFRLDVGGGMRWFIRHFLRDLGEVPRDKRDRVWNFIREAVEINERGVEGFPEGMKGGFPATYEEAMEFYR